MNADTVTADDVKAMAENLAGYISVVSLSPILPGGPTFRAALAAGGVALHEIAADPDKCQAIATGAEYTVEGAQAAFHAFWAIVAWLRGNGHDDVATALLTTK